MFRNYLKYCTSLIVIIIIMMVSMGCSSKIDHSVTIKNAIKEMKIDATKLGVAQVIENSLYFGSTKMDNNYELVDLLNDKYGCTATFFVKKEGEFIRISTNVMKDGHRAIGTQLDPNGPVIKNIKEGKPYFGIVDILGNQYETGYDPILNATGEIIGVYYVGFQIK